MTAQCSERLRYLGEDHAMATTPLSDYFEQGGASPGFEATSTALWRGYIGSWEITGGRLYLTGLDGFLKDGTRATLATVFPGFAGRVFAHWYCGTIRLPQGGLRKYVHGGFRSEYEFDLLLEVERGEVKGTNLRHNGPAPAGAPVGYWMAARTDFPPPSGGKDGEA